MSEAYEAQIAELQATVDRLETAVTERNTTIVRIEDQVLKQTARADAAEEKPESKRAQNVDYIQDGYELSSGSQIDEDNMKSMVQEIEHEQTKSMEVNMENQNLRKKIEELEVRVADLEE